MDIKVSVSFGELIDKITILQIKTEQIADQDKLSNIRHELNTLQSAWEQSGLEISIIQAEINGLKEVNQKLWDIEDAIRLKESKKRFDDEFIELARAVYFTNDRRAALKKQINLKLGSELVEEKSYTDYGDKT